MREFYRFVLGETWRDDDPSRRVEAPKKGRPLPKVLSREEMNRLIAAASARDGAQGLRFGCMVELAYASGLRISELTALPLAALARDPAYLIVRGKGGKERLAPLNDAARKAVKDYLPPRPLRAQGRWANPWLFPHAGRDASPAPLRPGADEAVAARDRSRRNSPRAAPRLATHLLRAAPTARRAEFWPRRYATTQIYTHVA